MRMSPDRFVSEGNILLFADQLCWEANSARQEGLRRLLIRELHQFRWRQEPLQLAERIRKDREVRIARQIRLIAEMKSNGVDPGRAECTLRTFQSVHFLFEQFCATYAERLVTKRLARSETPD